jgi:hypothetical protein
MAIQQIAEVTGVGVIQTGVRGKVKRSARRSRCSGARLVPTKAVLLLPVSAAAGKWSMGTAR